MTFRVLAVIPARGGSKRFPRKNVALFRGKPLILWTIEAARESTLLDYIVVSSDDADILAFAATHDTHIMVRPDALATDTSTNENVLRHALTFYAFLVDYVVLLQPTSPLRTSADIDACIRLCFEFGEPVVSYRADGTKNGAVYVAPVAWLADHDFDAAHVQYTMPLERSLDIDYPEQIAP